MMPSTVLSNECLSASIDMGVCNLIATTVKVEHRAMTYSGRVILSKWVYWPERIAKKKSKLMWFNRRGASKRLKKPFRKKRRRFSHAVYAILRDLFERPDGAVETPHLLAVLPSNQIYFIFLPYFLFRTSFRNRNRNHLTLINHHLLDICG
jgi:hypothetical protein